MPLAFRGFDVTNPINRLAAGLSALAINTRAYFSGGFSLRNPLSSALISSLPTPIHSLKRLNDSTSNGPSSGYALIIGAGTNLYCWNSDIGLKLVAKGLSGNPVSMVTFRPNSSPQPWCYVFDNAVAGAVTLLTKYLGLNSYGPAGTTVNFPSNGMIKVRSDGLAYKVGVAEPQLAPVVSTSNSSVPFGNSSVPTLIAKSIPWTNYPVGTNPDFNYGETSGFPKVPPDGAAPFTINCLNANTITITNLAVSGTVVINGTTNPTLTAQSSTRVAPGSTTGYPGQFIQNSGVNTHPSTASYIVGAFIDASGNVMTIAEDVWVSPLYVPAVVDVGAAYAAYLVNPSSAAAQIRVPYDAVAFQVGANSQGNTYSANSGTIIFSGEVTTNALPTVLSILGELDLYYWGDSSTTNVANYYWKNPDDGGTGTPRSTSNADGNATNNSFIFDATFTNGIPGLPGVGDDTTQMQWTTLNPDSVVSGSIPVFPSPIITTYPNNTNYSNFNFCLYGSIYVPSGGNYTFVLTYKDAVIWGIQGATLVSATSGYILSGNGQTITVAKGYPLLPVIPESSGEGGGYGSVTVTVSFASAGIYGIEVDYDYWYHSGRILLLEASATAGSSPTIIPPLPASVRQAVQYRYVYRSSVTGAPSNPSPESTAEAVPVTSNTITSLWSPDPQIDVVDYYRIDSTTSDFTYVNTGPNDNLGGSGTNTSVTDSLTDTQLGTQLLNYDNYEPFPVTDLPQKGVCNVSGGVITWVSGGAIGGTATGFNVRWLAGTEILIGYPTSLAYTFIARPAPLGFTATTAYPLNWIILDPANHYQLVTIAGISGGSTPTFNDSGGTTVNGTVTFTDKGIVAPSGYVGQVTIPGVPDGTNLVYEIEEPILANQPLPYVWGPSDNIPFSCACGDQINQGTMYWCEGNNLDAAPETNQLAISDPSEPLVNGCYVGGKGMVSTIKRVVAVLPNFFNALATATGTVGSTWSVRTTGINRGMFIPRCLCVSGGGIVYFRVDDGIHISPGGTESQSITDPSLYPLFSQEGSVPQPITRNGITIYPPDDTKPQLQKFSYSSGFMYYDYVGTDGNPHTLVFDEMAQGWIYDSYNPIVTIHADNLGIGTQGVLAGCADGTIRSM